MWLFFDQQFDDVTMTNTNSNSYYDQNQVSVSSIGMRSYENATIGEPLPFVDRNLIPVAERPVTSGKWVAAYISLLHIATNVQQLISTLNRTA